MVALAPLLRLPRNDHHRAGGTSSWIVTNLETVIAPASTAAFENGTSS